MRLDDSIGAAREIGMRFVATRGSMSVGQSQGGLPPDRVVEREDFILKDTQRVIEQHHDARFGSMLNVAVAPCSPFSVSRDLMRESALLARAHGVRMHTHLAENDHDLAYSQEKFHCTPTQYAQELGIAPIRRMLDAGVPVGLGVDGSASNDAAHMVNEARQALLLARVGRAMQPPEMRDGRTFFGCDLGPAEMTARDALSLATRGGAQVLGRSDIGHLAVGMCADLALFDLGTLGFAGAAVHDPIGALLLCASPQAAYTIVNGRVVVREGQLTTIDLGSLLERHNALALQLAQQAL